METRVLRPRPGAGEDRAERVATTGLRPPELDGHLHGSWEPSVRPQPLLELPHGPTRMPHIPAGAFLKHPLPGLCAASPKGVCRASPGVEGASPAQASRQAPDPGP